MRRLFFGFAGAVLAAALAGSCKEDPTASLAGGVAGVKFEYAYREITISDSFRTFAVEFDPAGNPLPPSATVTSCSNAVAAIAPASDTLTDTKPVFVDPRPFSGTAAGTSGAPTDTVRFLRDAAATRFNQDTSLHATFDFTRTPTFVARKTLDSLYVIVPPLGATAPSDLVIVRVDNNKVAEKVTFTSTTTSLLDRYDRASDDPTTAPAITANGDYYITLSGICKKGVVTLPADDCDDFFKVTNATAEIGRAYV